jgi:hypothetical protein
MQVLVGVFLLEQIRRQHYAADFNLYTVKLNLGYNFNIVNKK